MSPRPMTTFAQQFGLRPQPSRQATVHAFYGTSFNTLCGRTSLREGEVTCLQCRRIQRIQKRMRIDLKSESTPTAAVTLINELGSPDDGA